MGLEQFKNRNVGTQNYTKLDVGETPATGMDKFKQVTERTFKGELFVGLWVTIREMINALFRGNMHTVKYPFEKMPISPRYRAIHDMLRLLYDENQRKEVTEYTINFGRCIFCGYCAEVCPELAIVHGPRYETASEQRASFSLFEDMLTPIDQLNLQQEYDGFGAVSPNADANIKKTPLAY